MLEERNHLIFALSCHYTSLNPLNKQLKFFSQISISPQVCVHINPSIDINRPCKVGIDTISLLILHKRPWHTEVLLSKTYLALDGCWVVALYSFSCHILKINRFERFKFKDLSVNPITKGSLMDGVDYLKYRWIFSNKNE